MAALKVKQRQNKTHLPRISRRHSCKALTEISSFTQLGLTIVQIMDSKHNLRLPQTKVMPLVPVKFGYVGSRPIVAVDDVWLAVSL